MPTLQNLLSQTHIIKQNINSPLATGMVRLNSYNQTNLQALTKLHNQNQTLRKNLNDSLKKINTSGIRDINLVQSLNEATISIRPLTRSATDVKVSFLKSMSQRSLPDKYWLELKKQPGFESITATGDVAPVVKSKVIFKPVPLEKPIRTLHQAAGAIQNASTSTIRTVPEKTPGTGTEKLPASPTRPELTPPPSRTPEPIKEDWGKGLEVPRKLETPTTTTEPGMEIIKKPTEEIELAPSIPTSKPVLLKDLGFLAGPKLPKKKPFDIGPPESDEKLGVIPEKVSDEERLPVITDKKSLAPEPEPVHELTPRKITLDSQKQPLLPIMSALGLLAGSAAVTGPCISEARKLPEKVGYKPSITQRIESITTKPLEAKPPSMRPQMDRGKEIFEAPRQPVTFTKPPEAYGTIEPILDTERAKVDLTGVAPEKIREPELIPGKPVELESDQNLEERFTKPPDDYGLIEPKSDTEPERVSEITEVPESMKKTQRLSEKSVLPEKGIEIGEQYTKPETELEPTHRPLTWLPIASAVGSLGSLAAVAAMVNLQAKKELGYESAAVPIYGIPAKAPTAAGEALEGITTFDKTAETTRTLKKIELLKPTPERDLMVKPLELGKAERMEEIAAVEARLTEPIQLTIPKPGAIDTLDNIAKRTVKPKDVMFKPILPLSRGFEEEDRTSISTRALTARANLPEPAGDAISNLNLGAIKSSSSLFIEKIEPKPISEDKLKTTPGPSRTTELELPISLLAQPWLKPVKTPSPVQKTGFEKPREAPPRHSVLIEKSSFGALNQLTTMATVTAATATEIYSHSPTAITIPSKPAGSLTEIPTPEGLDISKTVFEKEPTEVRRLEPGKFIEKTEIGPGPVDAELSYLDGATTKPAPTTADAVLGTDLVGAGLAPHPSAPGAEALDILGYLVLSASRIRPAKQPVSRTLDKMPGRAEPSLPLDLSKRVAYRNIVPIADAMKWLRRPEERMVKRITGARELSIPAETKEKLIAGVKDRRRLRPELDASRHGQKGPVSRLEQTEITGREAAKTRLEAQLTKSTWDEIIKRLPTGAPEKVGFEKEQMSELEERIRQLTERLEAKKDDYLPSSRKLQEVIHDPNLQTQLKKLFYEAWLENMDKELKRYGE